MNPEYIKKLEQENIQQTQEIDILGDRLENIEDHVASLKVPATTNNTATNYLKMGIGIGIAWLAFMFFLFMGISFEGEYKNSKFSYKGETLMASLVQLLVGATGTSAVQYALGKFKQED